jgi:hypothetical protein
VLVESIRPEEKGVWQIRLAEISRNKVACELNLSPGRFKEYCLCDHYGKHVWRPLIKDKIKLQFRPAECKTLLLRENI